MNDLRSSAYVEVEDATIEATSGNLSINSDLSSNMTANVNAGLSSSGGSVVGEGDSAAWGWVFATNNLLGSARTNVVDSSLTAGGNITVNSQNTTTLDVLNRSQVTSGDQAVTIQAAFNTVGWTPTDMLNNAIRLVLGQDFISDEKPVNAEAFVIDSTMDAGGTISVTASNTAAIDAQNSNDAESAAGALTGAGGSTSVVSLALNKVSSNAIARIDSANFTFEDGVTAVRVGDRVRASDGSIYEYNSQSNFLAYLFNRGTDSLDLSTEDFSTSQWTLLSTLTDADRTNVINAGGAASVTASDNAVLDAVNDLKSKSQTINTGGLDIIWNLVTAQLDNYVYTTESGTRSGLKTNDKVYISDNYTGTANVNPGEIYEFIVEDITDFSAQVNFQTEDYGDTSRWSKMALVSNAFDFTTESTATADVKPGDVVEIMSGYSYTQTDPLAADPAEAGQQYSFVGEITDSAFDFATIDYANDSNWEIVSDFNLFSDIPYVNLNVSASSSNAMGFVVSYNDMRSDAIAGVAHSTITTTDGSIAVDSDATSQLTTNNVGEVTADGGSAFRGKQSGESVTSFSGRIATNALNSQAVADVENSTLSAGGTSGDVTVLADNTAGLSSDLDMETIVEGAGDTFTVGLAFVFNSIGALPQNILYNTIDALMGALPADNTPSAAVATVEDSALTSGRDIKVIANSNMDLDAKISSAAVTTALSLGDNVGISVSPVVALNRGSSSAAASMAGSSASA